MIRPTRGIAALVAASVMMNSVAFAATAPASAASGAKTLQAEVKKFRAAVDSGAVKTDDAIDAFAKAMTEKNVSYQDVDQFVRANTTEREYRTFRSQMDAALNGINPDQLSPEELGEIVGQALGSVRSEGLSWSSCSSQWTGVAVIVAAVVVGIFAILKSKSESSVRKDWEKKIAEEKADYDSLISQSQNWETEIPANRGKIQGFLSDAYIQYEYLYNQYYYAQDQQTQQAAAQRLQQLTQTIQLLQQDLAALDQLYASYSANPALAIADVAKYTEQRDAALADLVAQQTAAIANVPNDQTLGKGLGIGAGLGAAVGGYLLYSGIKGGGCSAR